MGRRNSGLDDPNSDVIGNSSNAIFDTRHRPIYRDQDLYNTTNTDWVDLMQENGRYEQYTFSSSNATEKPPTFFPVNTGRRKVISGIHNSTVIPGV